MMSTNDSRKKAEVALGGGEKNVIVATCESTAITPESCPFRDTTSLCCDAMATVGSKHCKELELLKFAAVFIK